MCSDAPKFNERKSLQEATMDVFSPKPMMRMNNDLDAELPVNMYKTNS